MGLSRRPSKGGRHYFLLLVDDYYHYMWLQLLTSKDEAATTIMTLQARSEAESRKKLCVLRTDCGGELTSMDCAAYCTDQEVVRHHAVPYSPQ